MLGGIYTDQKCKCCGGNLKDNLKDGLECPDHPEQRATRFIVKFGHGKNRTQKRFTDYEEASYILAGWRYKSYEGTFDHRDYRASVPLGFANLVDQYLFTKKQKIGSKHYRNIKNDLGKAVEIWKKTNVKEIGYAEIEDFLFSLTTKDGDSISSKTRSNTRSALRDFFSWLGKRRILHQSQLPEFPETSFKMGLRKTISVEAREEILDHLYRISWQVNPRIWIGIRFLSTYPNVRPKELINIKEKHIDLDQGYIVIPHPKEGDPKFVFLIDDDIELLRSMPRGFPELYFFRHLRGNGAAKPGQRFGHDYLYKWWKRACSEAGVEGVDLYGGTKHSTVIYMRQLGHSPEAIKRAAHISTNKAMERYLHLTASEVRPLYQGARQCTTSVPSKKGPKPLLTN